MTGAKLLLFPRYVGCLFALREVFCPVIDDISSGVRAPSINSLLQTTQLHTDGDIYVKNWTDCRNTSIRHLRTLQK
jgi:hypothetical protein